MDHREAKIRAATACPLCGAPKGEPCREGNSPHDTRRGRVDYRSVLHRAHQERRSAWQEWKRAQGQLPEPPPEPTPCPACGRLCSSRSKAKEHCAVPASSRTGPVS